MSHRNHAVRGYRVDEGAKAVITSLKGCHHLLYAIINTEEEQFAGPGMVVVQDLISPDNTSAIADLVAAAKCEKMERILKLGLKKNMHSTKETGLEIIHG